MNQMSEPNSADLYGRGWVLDGNGTELMHAQTGTSDVHNDKQLCIILGLVYLHSTESDGLDFCATLVLLSVENLTPPEDKK